VEGQADLKILRGGNEQELKVTIGELPVEGREARAMLPADAAPAVRGRLGLDVAELSDEQREKLGLVDERGVLVEKVEAGPARAAGIRASDVILMFNNKPVSSVKDLEVEIESLQDGQSVAVLVHRRDGPLFVALRIPREE
jgi:serine protease Do